MLVLLPIFGVLSGALTTIAGMGGGILLLIALSLTTSPSQALATTAPALLLSNLHRFWMFRRDLNRKVAFSFSAGALPGSLIGGALAARVPESILSWVMVAMAIVAVTRAFGLWTWKPRPTVLMPAGLGIGLLTGTSGGAGVLVAPLLLSSGVSGTAYLATGSLCAIAMHTGRALSYGAGGLISRETLLGTTLLTVALLIGNLAGRGLREKLLTDSRARRLEVGTLVACVALGLIGVGR